jgi:general secretion pathway protein J
MMSSNRHKLQRAFTLIEMLVVMIIVAMVVTLIVQGFGYTLGVYQRVVKNQNNAYQQVFAYDWFTSSLQAQVAMRPKDRGLEGDAHQLHTFSYQPLLAQQGLKTRIGWELVDQGGELQLNYREANQQFIVQRWTGAAGRFEYLDEKGQWVMRWPMEKSDLQPLPKAIRLVVNSGRETFNYVAINNTRLRAEVTAEEVMYGRD